MARQKEPCPAPDQLRCYFIAKKMQNHARLGLEVSAPAKCRALGFAVLPACGYPASLPTHRPASPWVIAKGKGAT